ncbi:MAG TPA: ABC transporter ATP-binding protein [Acidimicrobiia bacterium]|nr:ABC transporter ATP-binding protein [Acidimicrobiia bacterium]
MVESTLTGDGLQADFRLRRSDTFDLELSMTIPAGRTSALLGPNGAGKSTAVAAIAGLLPVDAGRITLGEAVIDDPEAGVFVAAEERKIGVVFQDYLLFPHLTVLENVAFGLRSRHLAREESYARARQWLERLGLARYQATKPGDLSGGQAQRVALARALVNEPDVLLLDEPLSALDVTTRSELRHVLRDHLNAFPGPRLLITHDPTEAFLLGDEIYLIEEGRITQTGSPDDIRLAPRTPYAADLAGSNLLVGDADRGLVDVGARSLAIADEEVRGRVLVSIHPTAISVHSRRPEGSQRNTWETTVERVEPLGSRVRLRTGDPVPLTVEVTERARHDLGVEVGTRIWIAFKATELSVQPDHII